jgi:hypothetical protein
MTDAEKQKEIWMIVRRALLMIVHCIERVYDELDD